MHFDFNDAVAEAVFASAACHIERKSARFVTALFRVLRGGVKFADEPEHARIGGGVGTGRPPNRGLVDGNDLVKLLHAENFARFAFGKPCAVQFVRQRGI